MNCCLQGNSCLWILIILLILGTSCGNVFSSGIFSGCGWPLLVACAYCFGKNGVLSSLFASRNGCGCNT